MSGYTGSNGQAGQLAGVSRDPVASRGVDVCIQGWMPGLQKVQLTKAFRDGGLDLQAASRLTGEVLRGRDVHAHFAQFDSLATARAALGRIGVRHVRPQASTAAGRSPSG